MSQRDMTCAFPKLVTLHHRTVAEGQWAEKKRKNRDVSFLGHAPYGACPKNETCAFSEGLTHHCTGAGGVGYESILN